MGVVACVSRGGFAAAAPPPAVVVPAARDGSHDFDFEIGEWTTHLKRLQHPLSGSTQWLEYDGTSLVTSLLDGRVNVVELRCKAQPGALKGCPFDSMNHSRTNGHSILRMSSTVT